MTRYSLRGNIFCRLTSIISQNTITILQPAKMENTRGRIPLRQHFQLNRLKCKWHTCRIARKIFQNKRTTFESPPLFLFVPVRTAITVPFTQNFHLQFDVFRASSLYRHVSFFFFFFYLLRRLQVWKEWEKPFPLTRKVFEKKYSYWTNLPRKIISLLIS